LLPNGRPGNSSVLGSVIRSARFPAACWYRSFSLSWTAGEELVSSVPARLPTMFDSRGDAADGASPEPSRAVTPRVAPLPAAKAIWGWGRVAASAVAPAAVRTVRRSMLRMRTPSLLRYRPHSLMGGFATEYATPRSSCQAWAIGHA